MAWSRTLVASDLGRERGVGARLGCLTGAREGRTNGNMAQKQGCRRGTAKRIMKEHRMESRAFALAVPATLGILQRCPFSPPWVK